MRIESALFVKRVQVSIPSLCPVALAHAVAQTKNEFNGNIWLGFERLTCVPIQTRLVDPDMLTKDEKQWIKVRTFRRGR